MSERAYIAACARKRIMDGAKQITHSLKVSGEGRPGDAEPDPSRRAAVLQARRGMAFDVARREALKTGPQKHLGSDDRLCRCCLFRARAARRAIGLPDHPVRATTDPAVGVGPTR
jgi:hypothetical protein